MRALLQRVTSASVSVGGGVVGEIGPGLCVLLGIARGDDPAAAARMARKLWGLRIFEDALGVANLSAADLGLPVLVVSQFTLLADTSAGRRPSYAAAARPEQAEPLVEAVVRGLREQRAVVATGRFGAEMQVALVNDGPCTVLVET